MEKSLEFDVPQGYKPPEDTREGQEFDSVATFKLEPGGKICLVAIDGVMLPEYSDKETLEEEDDMGGEEADFVGAIMAKAPK